MDKKEEGVIWVAALLAACAGFLFLAGCADEGYEEPDEVYEEQLGD